MKKRTLMKVRFFPGFCLLLFPSAVFPKSNDHSFLRQEFDLAKPPLEETQYFLMESRLITYALDGKRLNTDIFRLRLKYTLGTVAGQQGGEYSCARFTIQQGDTLEVEIPALENWSYALDRGAETPYVFGIDHSKFENLVDSNGNTLSFDKSYHVYNAFIDFHAFCNVFAEPVADGNGIQDLKKIGQKIIHATAFTKPPTNLGSNVSEGSFYKNGEITLVFKGLSLENGRPCALVGFDSGESSFKMIMQPAPGLDIVSVGSSHYKGDIYKDLTSGWVQKVTFNEVVISETTMPVPPNKINSVVERNILILNVDRERFRSY